MTCTSWLINQAVAHIRTEQFTTDAYPARQWTHASREALHLHSLRPGLAPATEPLYGPLTTGRTTRGVGLARLTSSPQLY